VVTNLHPSATMLSGVMVSATMLSGVRVSATMFSGVMVSATMLSGVMVSATMLSGVRVSATMLSGVMVSATMLSGVRVSATMLSRSQVSATMLLVKLSAILLSVRCYYAFRGVRGAIGFKLSLQSHCSNRKQKINFFFVVSASREHLNRSKMSYPLHAMKGKHKNSTNTRILTKQNRS
jgi:hypothetical protein